MDMWFNWLIVLVLLIVIQLVKVNLTSIWFILSALITFILSFFLDDLLSLFATFVLGGFLFMILAKPIVNEFWTKKDEKLNLDDFLGSVGTVCETINKNDIGMVSINGVKVKATAMQKINVDQEVIVDLVLDDVLKVHKKRRKKKANESLS